MIDYLSEAAGRLCWQMWHLFGMTFAIAYLLQRVGARIRGTGAGRFGDWYWYLIAPGVACHETGHALGCILTGKKVIEFVPFCRRGNTLGYVKHEGCSGFWGGLASVVISTGPIWFGCMAIGALTWLLAGGVEIAKWGECFGEAELPGFADYAMGVAAAAAGSACTVATGVDVLSVGFWVWLYLVFCIASEIGLSGVDLAHMGRGMAYVALLMAAVNVIPIAGRLMSAGVYVLMPYVFRLHVLMAATLGVNVAIWLAFRLVAQRGTV